MIVGVVLAAGQSSRLGRPKQLLPIQGEPLLRRTLRAILASSLDEVLVVVGHEAEAVREAIADLPVRIVLNPEFAHGQSTSVRAGLSALAPETEAAMLLLGDQSGVAPDVIAAVIAAWRETGAPVVAPNYTDGVGNPVLFAKRMFSELDRLRGDTGARAIVRDYDRRDLLELVNVAEPAPPDIDTEADYAALIATIETSPLSRPDRSRAPSGRRLGG